MHEYHISRPSYSHTLLFYRSNLLTTPLFYLLLPTSNLQSIRNVSEDYPVFLCKENSIPIITQTNHTMFFNAKSSFFPLVKSVFGIKGLQ